MFVYYYVLLDRPFAEVEPSLLLTLPGLRGWAETAYRKGEHLYGRIGPGCGIAKAVDITVGTPSRGESETWIPIEWQATGTPSLFPRMQADIVVAALGGEQTQIAFRGSYRIPLGSVGRRIDRIVLHRVAEASVKTFLDGIASTFEEDPARIAKGGTP